MNFERATTIWKQWGTPFLLLGLALAVRLPGLGGFVTFDEPRWIDRSRWFLTGLLFPQQECPPVAWGREVATHGLACTLQIGYPGASTMWAGSLGLLAHYWQTARLTGTDLLTYLQTLPIYRLDPSVIPPTRLPLVVTGALFVLLFYLLLRRLLAESVAIVAALIVALQPYQIALSRVLHHDALAGTFMVLSVLTLIGYWLRGWRWYWLLISAILAGLALLSKQVSWFLLPYVAVLAGWTLIIYRHEKVLTWSRLWRVVAAGILWGVVAALTVVTFFPATWVIPAEVIRVIISASTDLAGEGHSHYFLGQVSKNPGPLFYLLGWLLRATPLEVIGLLAGVGLALGLLRRGSLRQQLLQHPTETALFLFVALLWVFVSLSDKKLVRYYLPAFPIIDIFVAMGLIWLLEQLVRPWSRLRRQGLLWLSGLILVGQGWLVVSHYPYYLTYHNPLFGGLPGAARLMTIVGWGEGLDQAAAYLNRQPQAKRQQVVAERVCSMLRPFFVGQVRCLNSSFGGILQADYIVYYYNVIQRNLAWPEQWDYFRRHHAPVHRVSLHGLDYVLIYRNPIQHQVDREANSLPHRLTAFGYNLSPNGQLTLFWQNLGLNNRQLLLGLAPTRGVYPVEVLEPARVERRWIACSPDPAFADELRTPKAIIESTCPLGEPNLPAGLYDLQLAVAGDSGLRPVESALLGLILLDGTGHFESVALVETAQIGKGSY